MKPHARKEGLVVKELPDEMLVYDLERHRAHCLNRTAALVWKQCNGRRSVEQVTRLVQSALNTAPDECARPARVDERLVWLALDRLSKAHLLEEKITPPLALSGPSRRDLIRKLGLVGGLSVLLPLVSSIVAPTPAEAAGSCVADCTGQPLGTPCGNCLTNICDGFGACV